MKLNYIACFIALSLSSAAFAQQNEVILTSSGAKAGQAMAALDLVTSGEAVAFEFSVPLPKGVASVDTSKCLADLPSSHQGHCVFREKSNDVFVIAFSPVNAKLPGGVVPLGTIQFNGNAEGLKVAELVFAGETGQNLPVAPGQATKPARPVSDRVK